MTQDEQKHEDMTVFRQGVEAGYTMAVEELRVAVERGVIHKKCEQAVEVLETWALDAADRWLEDSGEGDSPAKA